MRNKEGEEVAEEEEEAVGRKAGLVRCDLN